MFDRHSGRFRGLAIGFRLFAGLLLVVALGGCASNLHGAGYYWQSIKGHLALMRAARPIDELIADPSTAPELVAKLRYALEAREFASAILALPRNGSYTSYAELGRDHVLWNVFATDELSMQLTRWCFPVAGCIAYRGYYARADAEQFAAEQTANGKDVQLAGVPAYSTLGWFDDPLPSTVLRFDNANMARLIFHELAHQLVYIKGDSTFNESFATAVQQEGMRQWLNHRENQGDAKELRQKYLDRLNRRRDFVKLLRATRDQLIKAYEQPVSDQHKRLTKAQIFERLQAQYRQLKSNKWQGYSGYDRWFAQSLGNAHLAAVSAYHRMQPAFQALLLQKGGDMGAFFQAVKMLAELDKPARDQALQALIPH